MSAALRDERCRVYGYTTASDKGRVTSTYAYLGEFWTRRMSPSSREATLAGQASQQLDAVFEFAGYVNVPPDGALRHQDGTLYKITGADPVRGTSSERDQLVTATYADEQHITLQDLLLLESGGVLLLESGGNLLLESSNG